MPHNLQNKKLNYQRVQKCKTDLYSDTKPQNEKATEVASMCQLTTETLVRDFKHTKNVSDYMHTGKLMVTGCHSPGKVGEFKSGQENVFLHMVNYHEYCS